MRNWKEQPTYVSIGRCRPDLKPFDNIGAPHLKTMSILLKLTVQACGGLLGLHTSTTVSEPGTLGWQGNVIKPKQQCGMAAWVCWWQDTRCPLCNEELGEVPCFDIHIHIHPTSIAFYLNHIQLQSHFFNHISRIFMSFMGDKTLTKPAEIFLQVLLTNDTTASVDSMDCQRLRLVQSQSTWKTERLNWNELKFWQYMNVM